MIKEAVVTGAALLLGLASPAMAEVIPVSDAVVEENTASSLFADLQAVADRAADYAQQLATYAELVNTYVNAVENTIAIPMDAINRATQVYTRTQMLAMQAQTVVGPDGTMMQRLRGIRSVGRGAKGTVVDAKNSAKYWNDQRNRQMDEDAKLLDLQDERKMTVDQLLDSAQTQAATAIGRQQTLQANAQLAAVEGMQLAAISDQLAAQHAYQVEKDEADEARRRMVQDMAAADLEAMRALAEGPAAEMNQNPIYWGR